MLNVQRRRNMITNSVSNGSSNKSKSSITSKMLIQIIKIAAVILNMCYDQVHNTIMQKQIMCHVRTSA